MSEMVERVVLRERPMIERVARIVWATRARRIREQDLISGYLGTKGRGDWTFDELEPALQEALREEARSAIAAMREPTEAMIGAGSAKIFGTEWHNEPKSDVEYIELVWPAMIDEALK